MNIYQNYARLSAKLDSAKKAVASGRCFFGPRLDRIVGELTRFNIDDAKQIGPLILELLNEIEMENLPQISLKSVNRILSSSENIYPNKNQIDIPRCESFIFVWKSAKLKRKMRIEFAIDEGVFYYISLRPVSFFNFFR